ncbi:hypothetical protein AAMO2058_001376600 [Amorphochlora amoebiformis]
MSIILNAFRSRPQRVFRIWLVRHGESMGNIHPSMYRTTPDHKIQLTARGEDMARKAGKELRKSFQKLFENSHDMGYCRMWVSPFARTRATAEGILEEAGEWISDVKESPFLVEQDWGLFEGSGMDDAQEHGSNEFKRLQKLRDHQGKFWARMPMGESCFDVCTRVSNLFGAVTRDRSPKWFKGRDAIENIVVVSHGVTIRAFVMMWCHYSPEWFEINENPPNCSIQLVEDAEHRGYIFPGYGHGGVQLEMKDVIMNPDPVSRAILSRRADVYTWTNSDTQAALDFFHVLDKDQNGRVDASEARKVLGPQHGHPILPVNS